MSNAKSFPFSKILLNSVFLISLLLPLGCESGAESRSQAVGTSAVPLKLKALKNTTLINSTEYVGTLEAQERVSLAPRINGRILNIFVREGELVKKGQKIVELESTQQQEEVNAASQAVNVEKSRLGQVQAELQSSEANRARAAAEVQAAKANLQDAEAQVTLAKINIERSQALVEGGALPKQNLDDRTLELDSAIAQRKSRQESLEAARKTLQAAENLITRSRANIESQKALIRQAEAQLGSARENLNFDTIKAPISGIIGSLDEKKVGDFINVGEPITTITNNQAFFLNLGIPTEERYRLKLGLPVEIVNDDGSPEIRGQISYIAPLVNQSTQSIQIKVSFFQDSSLRDREYVRAKVIWDERPGLLVPTTAVTRLGGQKFVFVAKKGESSEGEANLIVEQRPIRVGSIQGQNFQIISGVSEGDKIAVTRILDLKNGTSITEELVTNEQSKLQ